MGISIRIGIGNVENVGVTEEVTETIPGGETTTATQDKSEKPQTFDVFDNDQSRQRSRRVTSLSTRSVVH